MKNGDVTLVENRFIKDEEVQVFLNCCDFVLLSYRDILTSGSFFQAVTFDRPVLSPSLGSLQYYVCDGVNGYLYDSYDLKSILKSLKVSQPDSNVTKIGKCEYSDWPKFTLTKNN